MATYVIGDVHGQLAALESLWEKLGFDLERDCLWMVGDLVNRGPDSLGALRWARRKASRLGPRMTVVLGNHDLRLLAVVLGVDRLKKRDTLGAVLEAPDRDELVGWLRRRPLLHRRGGDVVVHAGLLPRWTLEEAEERSREAEATLQGKKAATLLADWRGRVPVRGQGRERRRFTLEVLTSLRAVDGDGRLSDHTGPPDTVPEPFKPWFRIEGRKSAGARIAFGHWAALGVHLEPGVLGLDGGAAWGRELCAVRLDDGVLFVEPVGAPG